MLRKLLPGAAALPASLCYIINSWGLIKTSKVGDSREGRTGL